MKKVKILVTGGPVGCNLDSVKLLTNRFKGGRMAELADTLGVQRGVSITYLTSRGAHLPDDDETTVVYHNGFEDYMNKVCKLAPKHDGVILGAAVCNLIPVNPWKGKFPSHNYKVGDIIPIDFTIAPRVIDEVKRVAPKTKLFGFKLLQGVKHQELIDAAYEIVLESKAVAVFANDANDLDTKYAVTKEKGVIKFNSKQTSHSYNMTNFILDLIKDEYYSTVKCLPEFNLFDYKDAKKEVVRLLKKYESNFEALYGKEKYKFGTVAVRVGNSNSFVTTARGKKTLKEFSFVEKVDHRSRKVYASEKATLNAPLLHKLLKTRKEVKAIVHYHQDTPRIAWCRYSVPGTVRDARIADALDSSWKHFCVEGHGTFKLLTEEEL